MRRDQTRSALVRAAIIYAAVTLVTTYPLIAHLRSAVPQDLGDPLLSASILWWNAHVLPLTERWWNGFAFYPAGGTMAFSDHRLGLSLLASPLQWIGCGPITAYNVAWLATFPLCALAAHVLVLTLTQRQDAAFIGGLAYGFNPYRVAHLSHLELLAAFGMPLALAALHHFANDRRAKWIGVLALALVIQGLCTTYYLLFFCVFLAMWALWFVRVREWRTGTAILAGCLACAAGIGPILAGYWRIHQHYGFARILPEVLFYSADVSSLFAGSTLLSAWHWTASFNPSPELQLFPGLTITLLAATGIAAAILREPASRNSWRWLSLTLLLVACVVAIVAWSTVYIGPWAFTVGGLRVGAAAPFKPITTALVALAGSLALRPWACAAWQRRSTLAFYVLAAGFLFLCSLGPKPTFFGKPFLYKPPYDWLMNLPGFGSVRAPARFAMLGILALSVAAALAFDRLRLHAGLRRLIAVAAVIGILVDGWAAPLALAAVPDSWPTPAGYQFGPVLELPLETDYGDFVAMYRTTRHRHPSVNGHSGFFAPHYAALQFALDHGDATAFDAFTRSAPLLVVVDRRADSNGRWDALVRKARGATVVVSNERWTLFGMPALPAEAPCTGSTLTIASAADTEGPIDQTVLNDRDPGTWWISRPLAQHAGDTVTVGLAQTTRVCAVRLSLGTSWWVYPRLLTVDASADAVNWTQTFRDSTAGLMIHGLIEEPRESWITVPVRTEDARFIRLRLEGSDDSVPWLISELEILGAPR